MDTGIPDKHYLRIGEVSVVTGLAASVLRYWESEFSFLKPKKSTSGQRLYTRQDIEKVVEIQKLLYAEKLTIEGARKRLAVRKRYHKPEHSKESLAAILEDVREELISLRNSL
jgi:DNA-binding transcriptional MerR regulator